MLFIPKALVAIIALLHFYFLYLEMFLWTKPKGLKTFGLSLEKARDSATLAANQGLYNGFLAAGLVWSLLNPNLVVAFQTQIFFLACIVIAGIYGGLTANRRILLIQAAPAAAALLLRCVTE